MTNYYANMPGDLEKAWQAKEQRCSKTYVAVERNKIAWRPRVKGLAMIWPATFFNSAWMCRNTFSRSQARRKEEG